MGSLNSSRAFPLLLTPILNRPELFPLIVIAARFSEIEIIVVVAALMIGLGSAGLSSSPEFAAICVGGGSFLLGGAAFQFDGKRACFKSAVDGLRALLADSSPTVFVKVNSQSMRAMNTLKIMLTNAILMNAGRE